MIKLGSTDITNVMLGTTKVDAIFLGNTKVYPNLPAVEGVYAWIRNFILFLNFKNYPILLYHKFLDLLL